MKTKDKATTVTYPAVGSFADEKAFKTHAKSQSDEALSAWATAEGLVIKDYGSAPINRMRTMMAIKELHFPSPPKQSKSKSPYAKYETEELVQMALDNNIIYEPTEDPKIIRMRTIMALRSHGIID